MRIPCAKCGYPHDSTVTPFMHDIIEPDQSNPNPNVFYNVATGFFECTSCGTKNKVKLIWGMEKEDNVPDNTNS